MTQARVVMMVRAFGQAVWTAARAIIRQMLSAHLAYAFTPDAAVRTHAITTPLQDVMTAHAYFRGA